MLDYKCFEVGVPSSGRDIILSESSRYFLYDG